MRKKAVENQYDKIGAPQEKRWFSPVFVQSVFLLTGVLITAICFITLSVFIKDMIRDEREHITQNTAENIAGAFSDLEDSMEAITSVLFLLREAHAPVALENIEQRLPQLENFDQIVWIYKSSGEGWRFANVHLKDPKKTGVDRYSVQAGEDLLSYVLERGLLEQGGVRIITDLPFVLHAGEKERSKGTLKPFAFVKSMEIDGSSAGLVIGVTAADAVFSKAWLSSHDYVSRVTVRDLSAGYALYHMEQSAQEGGADNVYEFKAGGRKWELRTALVKQDRFGSLQVIPLLIAFFGFVFTIFATLYLRSHLAQSAQVKKMYRAIGQKNAELKREIARREGLNMTLQKSERDNRSIIDAVSDIIFETDTDGKIVFLNATWRKVTGFDPEQSKGHEIFKMLHPEDQEQHREDFQLMIKGQKQVYRSFTRLRTSDGTFRAVELAISMIRQGEDKNLRVVGTFTDVEERRRAERALSEAEKKYRTIVENAAGGIYQLTPEGLYLSANPALARILGYDSPEDLLRQVKNANDTVYVSGRERQGFLRELESRGVVNNFETKLCRKDGGLIWVNENARAVRDETGNTLYYEGSLEDITQRKEAHIALHDAKVHSDLANRAKSEFLANMSHELRTPLNAIIGFSEIIKDEAFGPVGQTAYHEYATDIHQSGNDLLKVINEILDISKIEAGERQLNESVVDLGAVVKACLGLLSSKIETNHMTVSHNLEETPNIVAEELAIKQIMMNLLSNAIKFTPDGGRVTISSETDSDGQLRVAITDTGIGLSEAEMEKALSPFGQIDNDLSRSTSGTGLGLTLVDALVKLHGGELELLSQKGIGTTVTVVFPASRVAVQKSAQQKPAGDKEHEDAL